MKERYINEEGHIITPEGVRQNMYDFLATKPFVKRYYDYSTKNKSFINLHILLKKLGVKNHNEHLQIFDPTLIGVNARSETLSDSIKAKIVNECRVNPWYFFRELVGYTNSGEFTQFRLDLLSFTTIFFMLRCCGTLTEAPRQVGKTAGLSAMMAWLVLFGVTNTTIGNIHIDEKGVIKNLKGIEEILDALPQYLRFHKISVRENLSTDKSKKNKVSQKGKSGAKKTELKVDAFKNQIVSFVVGQSVDKANTTGRGYTVPIWMIDEFAHIKHVQVAYGSLGQAYTTAANNAKNRGGIYGIWRLCTPGDLTTETGQYVFKAINEDYLKFDYSYFYMFDMVLEEIHELVRKKSRTATIFISYEFDILGWSSEWLKEKSRSAPDLDTVRVEILLKWESNTAKSPFKTTTITNLENRSMAISSKSKEIHLDDENIITIYPRRDHLYYDFKTFLMNFSQNGLIIGCDVAFGVGGNGDSTTLVAVDPTTLETVFVYKRNDISVDDMAVLIVNLLDNYFIPLNIKLGLAIERNAGGITLINILKKYKDYARFLVVYPVSEHRLSDPTIVTDYTFDYYGVSTKFDVGLRVSSDSRDVLLNLLIKLVTKHTDAIAVKQIVDEVKQLVVKKSGEKVKIIHGDGGHDDVLFALMHAMYAIFYNADLLKYRNRIQINPKTFVVNEHMSSVNFTGNISKRIYPVYTSNNGIVTTKYWDDITKQYVDQDTANRLISEEKEQFMLQNIQNKTETEVVADKKYELPENVLDRIETMSDNIDMKVDDGTPMLQEAGTISLEEALQRMLSNKPLTPQDDYIY